MDFRSCDTQMQQIFRLLPVQKCSRFCVIFLPLNVTFEFHFWHRCLQYSIGAPLVIWDKPYTQADRHNQGVRLMFVLKTEKFFLNFRVRRNR